MRTEKDTIIEKEDNWNLLAKRNNYRCVACSTTIPYGDREVYFRTKMRGYCARQASKDK